LLIEQFLEGMIDLFKTFHGYPCLSKGYFEHYVTFNMVR